MSFLYFRIYSMHPRATSCTKESIDQTEVQLLNKQKTKLTVSNANIKPFAVDHGQMQGMKRD